MNILEVSFLFHGYLSLLSRVALSFTNIRKPPHLYLKLVEPLKELQEGSCHEARREFAANICKLV